jgi:hypothetical protein
VPGDLAALGPFFAVGSHPPGAAPAPPWRPAGELTFPSQALRDRIAAARAALAARGGLAVEQVEPRVAASAVHLGLAARLAAPALGAAVLRRPLDLRLAGLWWQDQHGGPVPLSVPLPAAGGETAGGAAARPPGRPARAPDAHRRPARPGEGPGPVPEWDRLLLDELLVPLTAAVGRLVPVSGRVLRGNVASAVNTAAAQAARQRPDLAVYAWQAAGSLFGRLWLRGERNPPGPGFRRSSCCLFYRLVPGNPAAVCGDCVLAGRSLR